MMTTDTILIAAKAAFAARYRGRPVRWDAQPWNVQQRWIAVTAMALNGQVDSGREFRLRYVQDMYPRDETIPAWSDLKFDDRKSWNDVYEAVIAERGKVYATLLPAKRIPPARKAAA